MSPRPSKIDNLWYHLKGITPPTSPPDAAAPPAISPYAVLGGIAQGVEQTAAGNKGTLSNWIVSRQTALTESRSRIDVADRAEDLIANDPHAASGVQSKAVNISGTGFSPQSIPPETVLGISKDQARAFQEAAEWAWYDWTQEADASGRFKFWQLQFMATWDFVARGEFFQQPVMMPDDTGRSYAFALQPIDTLRVYSPTDKITDDTIRDGITLGNLGNPLDYWVENPKTRRGWTGHRSSTDFARIPARIGHRPGMLHGFIPKNTEAVRGVSALAPAMKFFKDLADYLDFELVGAIIAASFPVFIETTNPYGITGHLAEIPGSGTAGGETQKRYYQETDPGQVMYGNANEKPHILESNRPGDTFAPFVERMLRALGAAIGLPYEVIAKDFSKTNYSSARAALLEMWRELNLYQKWMIDTLCQPAWDMVIEEAWLRGRIKLPKSAPDFYDFRRAWCRAKWTPPKKGHVDPVKEMSALTSGYEAGFVTLADVAAEMGTDWETLIRQRRREQEAMEELGLAPTPATANAANPNAMTDPDEETDPDEK